ncbi:MAG: hypothetical protein KDD55_10545, partial [Bdellovibrionales bacterium]|nr:hypothetical protein [Bdellovibrionales bacterium]
MTSFEGPRDHPRIPSERRDDQKSSPPRPQSIIGLPKGMGSWSSLAAPPNLMSRGARDYSSILLENSNTGRGASSRLKQASKKLETSEDFPRSFSALRDLTREIVERSRAWHIPFGSI